MESYCKNVHAFAQENIKTCKEVAALKQDDDVWDLDDFLTIFTGRPSPRRTAIRKQFKKQLQRSDQMEKKFNALQLEHATASQFVSNVFFSPKPTTKRSPKAKTERPTPAAKSQRKKPA